MPNLATNEGQKAIEPSLEGVDLVVLDNLSTLAQQWPRERGGELDAGPGIGSFNFAAEAPQSCSCIMPAKAGQQRGTSRREDILDTVIALKRPHDYNPTEGARFIVEFEKARGLCGDGAKSFEARLETNNGGFTWSMREIADANYERVKELLLAGGLSLRDIAKETGISKSTVERLKKRAEAEGLMIPRAA